MTEMRSKPKASNSESAKELDRVEKQFKEFEENINTMSLDRMNSAPLREEESQTKISQNDKAKMASTAVYLKPKRSISSREIFNERFRDEYDYAKEYVYFTAENKEIIGETIEFWTKPFPGVPAEEWAVPTNKPLWAPRHVAERIHGCRYHRFTMQQHQATGTDGMGQYYGAMAVDTVIQRLDATPETTRKSIFMGANNFK